LYRNGSALHDNGRQCPDADGGDEVERFEWPGTGHAQSFPWQFAGNFQKWVGRWSDLPVDQHMVVVLDELTGWAPGDLSKHGFLSLVRYHRACELQAHRRVLQSLILDLPAFELYLTDPRAGLAAGMPIRIYRALVRQLGLAPGRRALDERVEVVEAIFDSLAESHNHRQALAFQLS
jgi:hypothetical protein